MTEQELEAIIVEEIRKAVCIRSFRFLSIIQQRKIIEQAIRKGMASL